MVIGGPLLQHIQQPQSAASAMPVQGSCHAGSRQVRDMMRRRHATAHMQEGCMPAITWTAAPQARAEKGRGLEPACCMATVAQQNS